jgi:serine/threonine-protein kinase RsbW
MSEIGDPSRFVRTRVAAEPRTAARIRADLGNWLDRHFSLDAEQRNDLLLAVNEAVANAAEFAYADAPRRGTMDVRADYDDESDTLAVTIKDRGRWRPTLPEPATVLRQPQVRGRGIPLMRVLADEVAIERAPDGTHVRLTWTGLARRSEAC